MAAELISPGFQMASTLWDFLFIIILITILLTVSILPDAFILLGSIPLCGYTTICLPIQLLMDIWVALVLDSCN